MAWLKSNIHIQYTKIPNCWELLFPKQDIIIDKPIEQDTEETPVFLMERIQKLDKKVNKIEKDIADIIKSLNNKNSFGCLK